MEKSNKITSTLDGLIQNENFIIFGEDFDRHPHALEHLLRPLFAHNKFIWVETIGLRSPKFNLYDLKRIFETLKKWIIGKKKSTSYKPNKKKSNIIIISPFMIPFNQYFIFRKFNQWNVTRSIKKTLARNISKAPISIASVPNACDYIGHFKEQLKIYYCVDEFSLWPGLDKKLVEKLEKKLIQNVDHIIATSEYLYQSKRSPCALTSLLTHGVDLDHFNIGPLKFRNQKVCLCYFGLFDERSDQTILIEIAKTIPDCEVHILGKVACDIKKLKSYDNIIFHGNINYNNLPNAISTMDIFLLPYVRNKLTDNINPLKLKEYLSTGRPVFATELPEVVKLKDYLHLAKTPQDFITLIKNYQKDSQQFYSDKVFNFIAKNETWMAKSKLLSELITDKLPEQCCRSMVR